MSGTKKSKAKFNFIIIYIIGFIISIFFEYYWINYYPYDYFMLFGIGIIMCIFGYLSIDGILNTINQTTKKRDEQNEIMIKASKAIYLTTKKIALNNFHSGQNNTDPRKDISSLINDLTQANDRLAKEVENAVSLQSLVQESKSIVNNARDIIDHSTEQPLSPLEIEKDLKPDEVIGETDFETITQPETIDSMMEQEAAVSASEPLDNVIAEEIVDVSSETQEPADSIPEPEIRQEQTTAETSSDSSVDETPVNTNNSDTPLTPDEIASLFANL